MFDFLKRKSKPAVPMVKGDSSDEKTKKETNSGIAAAAGFSAAESAKQSAREAAVKFAKPDTYSRKLYDNGSAKFQAKKDAFAAGGTIKDPYTGNKLKMTKSDAKAQYGSNWQKHLAEADHKTPIKNIFDNNKNNPWLTNDDIKNIANSSDNLEVVSRQYNNAKRSRTNEQFVTDDEYLKKTGVKLTSEGKGKAIASGKKSQAAIKSKANQTALKNAVKTGHDAGVDAAHNAGTTTAAMSGILNITAVINGEKEPKEALVDTIKDTGKGAATGYIVGNGATTITNMMSNSSAPFIRALAQSNVPANIISAVVVTGDVLKQYAKGEISTQECIIALGEKGLTCATMGYSMTVGQALIPIPVVGAAVGALVGSMLTSDLYNKLINTLQTKQLEHQERLRIIAECEEVARQAKAYRAQLEVYIDQYFSEYRSCFDEALSTMNDAFARKDADGIIAGANQITRKLGGRVNFDTVSEFKNFLTDDSIDIL